jgi:cytochrome P450
MGINIKSQEGNEFGDLYIKSTQRAFKLLYERVIKIWYAVSDPLYKSSSLYRDFNECCQVFHKLTDKVIEQKRQNRPGTTSGKRQKTFIDELFHQASIDNKNWTNKEIRDEISSMIAAGADTTSHSLAFTVLLLAMFPEVQEKVFQEITSIDESIECDDGKINIEACNRMTYTGQVIKESLRLFTSSTIIGRYTTGDVKIKTNGLVIPSNVYLIIGISMLHRDPKHWGPVANEFNPENFSKENIAKRHRHSFVAFSGGQRNCVGLKFANLSMKVMLFKLLKAYRLETDEKFEDIKCEFHLLMKKVGGWKIKLHKRQNT